MDKSREFKDDENIALIIRTPTSTNRGEKKSKNSERKISERRPLRPPRNRATNLFEMMGILSRPIFTWQETGPPNPDIVLNIEEKTMGENSDVSCLICLDNINIGETIAELGCGHLYHHNCIKSWGKYKQSCPHCFRSISYSKRIV